MSGMNSMQQTMPSTIRSDNWSTTSRRTPVGSLPTTRPRWGRENLVLVIVILHLHLRAACTSLAMTASG